ncbi:MAG: DUF3160 domain-containing protein [Anaerolineae bacterium]|nr:DUF3160 domain-containing protein [Anaerolineae bacterium]
MKQRSVKCAVSMVLSIVLLAGFYMPWIAPVARAQDGICGDAPPPRLTVGGDGQVSFTNGLPLNVRAEASLDGAQIAQLPEGTGFTVLDGPVCADNIYWWNIQSGVTIGWIAEGAEGEYFVEPVGAAAPSPAEPAPIGQPGDFVIWNWAAMAGSWGEGLPDPMTIAPPPVYAGDLPALPVDLGSIRFLEDAQLNEAQLTLLAQNGFVVVPGGFEQFYEAYYEGEDWSITPPDFDPSAEPSTQDYGHAYFVTTDAMLHTLHYIFDNLLTDLEKESFYAIAWQDILLPTLQTAHTQTAEAAGGPLADAAYNAELYLAVALELFSPGQAAQYVSADMAAEVDTIAALALAGQDQIELPFIPGYLEDFSQYRPRGHYAGDELLERYFRGMMWLSRITFRANSDTETQIALLLLRALRTAPGAPAGWQNLHDTLTFLIGPVDDLGPPEYSPLVDAIYGSDLSLDSLADPGKLAAFRAQVAELPGPRVNGLILPDATQPDEIAELTRGFRFLGQRFTFDAYAMQQLMYSYVGTREDPRLLPLGLDVPAVMGSDTAYTLADAAGATAFANYDSQVGKLRGEIGALTPDDWLQNTYGGWLWSLKPLWARDPAPYPPLMQTEAWLRRDLQAGLASWTELKHDTVLYAKQPGGFGGGGPPLASFGYIEPNPLVFARMSVVAMLTYRGLIDRGVIIDDFNSPDFSEALYASTSQLNSFAFQSVRLAEAARKELAGEPLSEEDYWMILGFRTYLYTVLYSLYQGDGKPDPVALVTDVANNPSIGAVLQEGVGNVDTIFVVVPAPDGGLQVVRGGVFSYYEFVGDINKRMTDDEWRALVASGDLPPRPDWISAFYSE